MNLRLIPFRTEFIELFIQWRNQSSSVRHNPLKSATSEEIASWLKADGSDLEDLKKFETYRWFVQFGNDIVGNVSLKNVSHMMAYAEIGYGIAEAFQGRGIATEAVNLLVQRAFTESPLRKLIAYVHDKNVPSCRVLEKVGFQREGILREHYIINGSAENEILYGLLKNEWQTE